MSTSNPNPHAFVTVFVGGVEIDVDAEHNVVVHTDGTVQVRPAIAEPTTAAAPVVTAAIPKVGDVAPDGSVFAGHTADGKQQIYAMPTDLGLMLTFNDAAKLAKELNADKSLGHDDWQIPSLEQLRVLYQNQDKGALKGTFKTAAGKGASIYAGWYWSSTEPRGNSAGRRDVHFSDGREGWTYRSIERLSCRPVRVVPTKTAGTAP